MSIRFMVILAYMICAGPYNASAQMMLQKAAVSAGGAIASNSSQKAGMTTGQPVIGTASNGQTVAHFGFWNGTQSTSGIAAGPVLNVSMQTWPNPAGDLATVRVNLTTAANLDLRLFDINGKQVSMISSGDHAAGTFDMAIDLSGLVNGNYVLAARIPGQLLEQSISVIR
jgi:hypothetical protein